MFPTKLASSRKNSPAPSKLGSTLEVTAVPNQTLNNSDLALALVPIANSDIAKDIKAAEDIAAELAEAEIEAEGESSDEKEAKKRPSEELSLAAERERAVREHRMLVKTALTKFIKYNQNLQHLNLSHTGLNENVLKKVCTSLSKSRALICIHLSGNPGINDKNVNFLKERIHCREQRAFKAIDWTPIDGENGPKKLTTTEIKEKHDLMDQETR